jgi:hypothetical protein
MFSLLNRASYRTSQKIKKSSTGVSISILEFGSHGIHRVHGEVF